MMLAAPSIRRMPTVAGGGASGMMQLAFGSYGLVDGSTTTGTSGPTAWAAHGTTSQALVGLRLSIVSTNRVFKLLVRINGSVQKVADFPINGYQTGGWFERFIPLDIPAGSQVETGLVSSLTGVVCDVYIQGAASAGPIGVGSIAAPPGSNVGTINGQGANITLDGTTNWSPWTPIGTALTAAAKGIATAHIAQANVGSGRTAARIWAEFGFGPDAATITPLVGNVLGNNVSAALQGIDAGPVFRDIPSGSIIHFRARSSIALSGAANPISGQVAVMYP